MNATPLNTNWDDYIGHYQRGRFVHDNIATASPVRGERTIGWVAHHAIGIAFAAS